MAINDPVPSTAFDVLQRNVQDVDRYLNTSTVFNNRVGLPVKPIPMQAAEWQTAIGSVGWFPVGGDFSTGATLTARNQVIYDPSSTAWYSWGGTLPKTVPASSSPASTGGISAGAWTMRSDAALATALNNGTALINGLPASVLRYAVALAGVKSLPLSAEANSVLNVLGFYPGSTIGGGAFVWVPSQSKTDHNGGTIIAPEAIAAWDGTAGAVSDLLSWSGSGFGCYVRRDIDELFPEYFGAPSSWDAGYNDHAVLVSVRDSALQAGLPIRLRRMYSTTGLVFKSSLTLNERAITVRGSSGAECKSAYKNATGFIAYGNGAQDFVVRLGESAGSGNPSPEGFIFENVYLCGADKQLAMGVLYASRASQSKFKTCSIRRSRGPLVRAETLEDANFLDCTFGLGGDNTGVPLFAFGERSATDPNTIGSNAVMFTLCRFEFADGPLFGTVPGAVNAWVSTILLDSCKFEMNQHTTGAEEPLPPATYGANRFSYHFWDFRDALRVRTCIVGSNLHFSTVQNNNCAGVFAFGDADQILLSNIQMSASSNDQTIHYFTIEKRNGAPCESRNVMIKDVSLRRIGGGGTTSITYSNKSFRPMLIDMPVYVNQQGITVLKDKTDLIYASEAAGNGAIYFVTQDPDPLDPCLSPWSAVASATGSNAAAMMLLSADNAAGVPSIVGATKRLNRFARLWVRAKKSGNAADARISLSTGPIGASTPRATLTINSTEWAWYQATVDLTLGDNWRVSNNVNNLPDHSVFVDCARIELLDYFVVKSLVNPTNLAPLARYTVTIPADGAKVGATVNAVPDIDTRGLMYFAYVPSDGQITLILQNLSSADVDLVERTWSFNVSYK